MQLLHELQDRGFKVSVVKGDTLKVIPGSKLTPELTERLKAHKPELIQILSTELPANYYDKHVEAAIAEFNSRGISIMDVPEINRKRASKLDKVMSEAANHNDRKAFLKALREWRQCFH
jgi:hypothetical protein